MFTTGRKRMIEGLERLRRVQCVYTISGHPPETDPEICDCKFGFCDIPRDQPLVIGDERSCCPELRQAIMILSEMTNEEYETITTRANDSALRKFREKYK